MGYVEDVRVTDEKNFKGAGNGKTSCRDSFKFSAISFGIGIFENSIIGLLLGSYSLVLALAIMWRVSE